VFDPSLSTVRRPVVWIVDDSPTEVAITERSLGDEFEFEKFGDGATVVERISTAIRLPDVLLLDWVMPGMTGDQVCRFLRSRPLTHDLPIIIVTASRIDTADIVAGLAIGANDYVPRPFAPQELRARVRAVLRTKQLSDLATRERQRLTTVNRLGHALIQTLPSPGRVIDELARVLTAGMCDGCAVVILPGAHPEVAISRHRYEAAAAALAQIGTLADPVVHTFATSEEARAKLPPAYRSYIERFGLRGLAILPFPTHGQLRAVVTVTRERDSEPFDAEDIATIETCIEYTSLAIERVLRFDSERVAREQLSTVLASLPIGILTADQHGALTLANAAARALIPGCVDAPTLADAFKLVGATAPEPISGGSVDVHVRATGERGDRTIAVSAVPLRDGENAVVGSLTVLEDVSAARAIAAERERTSRFLEDMLAIVGHDLRSPLGAVLTASELLEDELAPGTESAQTVRRIQNSVERMTRIIEQLLDVTQARLGAGIPVAVERSSLVPIVASVLDELRLAYPKTTFELVGSADVHGTWDADRLGQVISNLASNAAQYGPPGAPVAIEVARDATTAIICVRNAVRGAPIPPDVVAGLFDPYRRGAAVGHRAGLGLGLYIVQAIVRAHHGTIDVDSTMDGTVFRVRLPLGPAA
jgi:signal transduction histidine kinase/CheY-like chemotaxis protein